MDGWKLQVASDIDRDGLGLELIAPSDEIMAEAFRFDSDKTLSVTTFDPAIPATVWSWYVGQIRPRLQPFEDGTPLPPEGEWRWKAV